MTDLGRIRPRANTWITGDMRHRVLVARQAQLSISKSVTEFTLLAALPYLFSDICHMRALLFST
jgi:hypothetical protein